MEQLSMCRICLSTDIRLCSIPSHLQDMYQKLTALTFMREDGRPLVACYICCARLRNCYQLSTSCLQSDELLTQMLCSNMLLPQKVPSLNSLRSIEVLNLSLVPALEGTEEGDIKEEEEDMEITDNTELEQQFDIDIEYEVKQEAVINGNNQCSHVIDPIAVVKLEPDDNEYDAKIKEDVTAEDSEWERDGAGTFSHSANIICPKIVKVVLERLVLNDTKIGILSNSRPATPKNSTKTTTRKVNRNDKEETTVEELDSVDKNIVIGELVVSKLDDNDDKVVDASHEHNTTTVMLNEQTSKTDVSFKKKGFKVFIQDGEKQFQCNVCNKCFRYRSSVKGHIATHTGETYYFCDVCKKCFKSKYCLNIHTRIHTGENLFKCQVCNKSFHSKYNLDLHTVIHNDEKPFMCEVCNKGFRLKYQLTRHTRTHTGVKPHMCQVCSKSYYTKHHLVRHTRVHTDEKAYMCQVCNKSFYFKDHLVRHSRMHTGEKPHMCKLCNKYFTTKSQLDYHTRIHTGEKPFMCQVCKKCFRRKFILDNHILIHTGEKPFSCNVCKKRFRNAGNLKKHSKIHPNNDNLFSCDMCEKHFNCSFDLKEHIRIHTGEKQFRCDVCKESFSSKSSLIEHIGTHTKRSNEMPFICLNV